MRDHVVDMPAAPAALAEPPGSPTQMALASRDSPDRSHFPGFKLILAGKDRDWSAKPSSGTASSGSPSTWHLVKMDRSHHSAREGSDWCSADNRHRSPRFPSGPPDSAPSSMTGMGALAFRRWSRRGTERQAPRGGRIAGTARARV